MVVGNDKRCSHGPRVGQAGLAAMLSGGLVREILGVHLRRSRAPRPRIFNLHTHEEAGPDLARRASAPVEASFYGWLLGGFEYKITIDFTGGHQNESMLAYLFRVLLTSFQPPGRSPDS